MSEQGTQVKEPMASAIKSLGEAGLLLEMGIQKIFLTHDELSASRDPISEALRISERHAMDTLAAVEEAQAAVQSIYGVSADGAYIDPQLHVIQAALNAILAAQQGQDLAGQRLKKAITLIDAVRNKIQAALREMGVSAIADSVPEAATKLIRQDHGCRGVSGQFGGGPACSQEDVDALLEELGI